MFLKNLNLQNFRLFHKKNFDFSENTTLIVGPNASGKTNILEAIYLLATGKSFRASVEKEMIRYGEEIGRVSGEIGRRLEQTNSLRSTRQKFFSSNRARIESDKQLNLRRDAVNAKKENFCWSSREFKNDLEITLTTGEVQGKRVAKKLYKVNDVGRRWRDFVGNLRCVLFRPEDIDIILGSPSIRRDYLDSVLEQVDSEYRRCNLSYKKGLRQRNKLLDRIREGEAQRNQLEFWNRLLIKDGEVISHKREELIDFFNGKWNPTSPRLRGANNLTIEYDKSVISQARLDKYAQAEVALGATLVGPHRDDIKIKMKNLKLENDRDLALYGSRGEQRMAILVLKLAELEFITKKSEGNRPILLLDDIFSELDSEHRSHVLSIISRQQTIITTTDIDLVEKKFVGKMEVVRI